MALLGGIKVLLHDKGMTIKGVQRILSEDGQTAVSAHSPELDADDPMIPANGSPVAHPSPPPDGMDGAAEADEEPVAADPDADAAPDEPRAPPAEAGPDGDASVEPEEASGDHGAETGRREPSATRSDPSRDRPGFPDLRAETSGAPAEPGRSVCEEAPDGQDAAALEAHAEPEVEAHAEPEVGPDPEREPEREPETAVPAAAVATHDVETTGDLFDEEDHGQAPEPDRSGPSEPRAEAPSSNGEGASEEAMAEESERGRPGAGPAEPPRILDAAEAGEIAAPPSEQASRPQPHPHAAAPDLASRHDGAPSNGRDDLPSTPAEPWRDEGPGGDGLPPPVPLGPSGHHAPLPGQTPPPVVEARPAHEDEAGPSDHPHPAERGAERRPAPQDPALRRVQGRAGVRSNHEAVLALVRRLEAVRDRMDR